MTSSEAFAYCERMARQHYENFPVASLLLPRALRKHVASIYAFARTADDFADEEDRSPDERLRLLQEWEGKLDACYAGKPDGPVFVALAETVRAFAIPRDLPAALLAAFRMDVTKHRYRDLAELLAYCRNSANPVGRLVLALFRVTDPRAAAASDAVCTGLQMANFWQDLAVDLRKDRIYLPLEDCARFGYTEEDLRCGTLDDRFRALMRYQVDRTRAFLRNGLPLLDLVGGGLRLELAATIGGGNAILDKIEQSGFDVLHRRPVLGLTDKLLLLGGALRQMVR
jgi:squalene synthase HpnC